MATRKFSAITQSSSNLTALDFLMGVTAGNVDLLFSPAQLTALIFASPTITGHATIEGVTATGATGTGKFVFDTSPTLVTPVLGVAAGTSLALGGATIGSNALAVTGTVLFNTALGVASGGTGLASGTSGGILGYTASGTLASSVALTNHAIVLGAGAGATPTPLGSLGTTTTVLHGNASGAPTFGAVNLATDVTGSLPTPVNAQTGTSYTFLSTDIGGIVTFSNASAVAVTLPQATGSFGAGSTILVENKGVGTVTITPTTSNIDGSSTLALTTNQGVVLISDGTNYTTMRGIGGGASGLTVGTTTITSGTSTRILYDNAGTLGEYTISGTGTVVAMAAGPTFTTPTLGVAAGTSLALGGATIGSDALGVAGTTTLQGTTVSGATLTLSGNQSKAAWTTTGTGLVQAAASFTDTSSSGTVAAMYVNRFGIPTILASSATVYTSAYGLWVEPATASTNVTITNNFALGVNGLTAIWGGSSTTPQIRFAAGASTSAYAGFNYNTALDASVLNYIVNGLIAGGLTPGGLRLNGGGTQKQTVAFGNTDGGYGAASMDTFVGRGGAAATVQLGQASAASPVNQTLQAQGSRSGTDSNVGGANFTIQSGNGTGTGTASSLIFNTPVLAASGSGAQTQTMTLTLVAGVVQFGANGLTANSTTATVLGSVGPSGANTTVQEWLTVKGTSGTTRYIPCF